MKLSEKNCTSVVISNDLSRTIVFSASYGVLLFHGYSRYSMGAGQSKSLLSLFPPRALNTRFHKLLAGVGDSQLPRRLSLPILRRILVHPIRRDYLTAISRSIGLASRHRRLSIHLHLLLRKKALCRLPSFAISVNTRTSRRILHLHRHRRLWASMRRPFWVR